MPTRILAGASARREPAVLEAHLKTLLWQETGEIGDLSVDLCHVDDFIPAQRKSGREALQRANSTILSGRDQLATLDFDDTGVTHAWSHSAIDRVAANKQLILDKALRERYDYVWIVDTDLLLDPSTLRSMLHADKPIVAAVYWTRWNSAAEAAAPQCWLLHPYQLAGRGMDQAEFRRLLADRQLCQVWGLGACMLLRTDVLRKGIRYSPLLDELVERGKREGGMWAGEDRTFCTLAENAYVDMYADAWPDIFHVYRPEDAAQIPYWLGAFQAPRALTPQPDDLVSLKIDGLEEVKLPTQHVRGRLAALGLLPELEVAVRGMKRGESRLISLHFPLHYPFEPYRGQSRKVHVTLVDFKPFGYAPTLADEMLQVGGLFADSTFYTPEQLAYVREAHTAA